MERIVLEVDSRLAEAWRNSSPEFKLQVEEELNFRISRCLKQAQKDNFKNILNEIREEAATNGLTEEILEEILRDENK